jgi:hypothetical protein
MLLVLVSEKILDHVSCIYHKQNVYQQISWYKAVSAAEAICLHKVGCSKSISGRTALFVALPVNNTC